MKRLRIGLIGVAVVALLGGGWGWLRDSSLVAVNNVQISGITASNADQVRAALSDTASTMTTLHVRRSALLGAVARFSSVGDLKVNANFPHTLTIQVVE